MQLYRFFLQISLAQRTKLVDSGAGIKLSEFVIDFVSFLLEYNVHTITRKIPSNHLEGKILKIWIITCREVHCFYVSTA